MAKIELKKQPYRLVPLARIVLLKLYVCHLNDDERDKFSVEDILELFPQSLSRNLIRNALDFLRGGPYSRDNLIARHGTSAAGYKYTISQNGILLVEKGLSRKDSDLSYFMENGDEALDEIAGLEGIFWTADERFDSEAWQPLDIDRSAEGYKEAIAEIETAIEVVRSDNGFAVNYPKERSGILASLETGLDWLKSKLPTRSQIEHMLLAPLRWVMTAFPNALLGEAAKRAAQKVIDWLMTIV